MRAIQGFVRYAVTTGDVGSVPEGLRSLVEITVGPDLLHVAGEIDASSCGLLRDAIDAAGLANDGPVRLDMSGVSFMDSSAIGVLVGSYKTRVDGVVIVRASPAVERVLKLTGLYQRFTGPPDS